MPITLSIATLVASAAGLVAIVRSVRITARTARHAKGLF